MFSIYRPRRLLRTALLVLLALGMVIKPTLGALGELHGAEHATMADAGAHGHAHPADSDGSDHRHGDERDPDHTLGAHGLLHLSSGVSVTLPDLLVRLLAPSSPGPQLPESDAPRLPGDSPSFPFRPPIA